MLEVTTEAVVLDKEDLGEYDSRVFLYTKEFGRIAAKATSLRKITSKIAGHLEPLNYVMARLISRGDYFSGRGFQLADALLIQTKVPESDLNILREQLKIAQFLKMTVPDNGFDAELWNFLLSLNQYSGQSVKMQDMLKILGFDQQFASCELCDKQNPEYFYPKNNFFVCQFCSLGARDLKENLLLI
ncbi:MAG: recombination protein O N-terminal domain-containing protein [bacterium]|jgi:DNA repair protein RecO (recombination protein O)|nr:recombination protein O N-terminal domain-containing protein [bacterium]